MAADAVSVLRPSRDDWFSDLLVKLCTLLYPFLFRRDVMNCRGRPLQHIGELRRLWGGGNDGDDGDHSDYGALL